MRFINNFKEKQTPEWRSQYYNYERAKQWLAEQSPPALRDINFESQFLAFNQQEVERVQTFFHERLTEAQQTFGNLKTKLENPLQSTKKRHLKSALCEFYLSLLLLKNYHQLNVAAFQKIVTRFDKRFNSQTAWQWWCQNRTGLMPRNNDVNEFGDLGLMLLEIERLYTEKLAGGNRKQAMKQLRAPRLGEARHSGRTFFRAGVWLGSLTILIAVIAWLIPFALCEQGKPGCWRDSCPHTPRNLTSSYEEQISKFWNITIRLYRGTFLFSLMILLLGVNCFGWAAAGINRVLIFELDPRHHLSALHLVEFGLALLSLSSMSFAIWLFQFYAACTASNPSIVYVVRYIAFATLMAFVLFLINPFPIAMHRSRFWLLKCLFRIMTAPFNSVRFADFWLADQLTSLVPVFQDFAFIICAISVELTDATVEQVCDKQLHFVTSAIGCLPAWFRFWQCVKRWWDTRQAHPHLTNAGKYSTTFFVIIFKGLHWDWDNGLIGPGGQTQHGFNSSNPFVYLWILAATVGTVYTFTWDILMDLGLGKRQYKFLREKLVYKHRWYYYVTIAVDAVLRCTWILTVADVHISSVTYINTLFTTGLTFVEMFRRFVWNFFRLELEHLNNVTGLRAVRENVIRFDPQQPTNVPDGKTALFDHGASISTTESDDEQLIQSQPVTLQLQRLGTDVEQGENSLSSVQGNDQTIL